MVDFFSLPHPAHPLNPPLEQFYYYNLNYMLFKRGKEFERGLSPLSPEFPFPAINIRSIFTVSRAGEGIEG
jgi:hypothetical protein